MWRVGSEPANASGSQPELRSTSFTQGKLAKTTAQENEEFVRALQTFRFFVKLQRPRLALREGPSAASLE